MNEPCRSRNAGGLPAKSRQRALVLSSLMALSLVAPMHAQSQTARDWPSIVAAAKKSGKVQLYSVMPASATQQIADGFRKAHPDITIEAVALPSIQLLAKVDQERASGSDGADVFLTSEIDWMSDKSRDKALLAPAGPSLKGWPERYLLFGTVPVVGLNPWVIPYNKNLVKVPPTSYQDLLRPEYKGKIGTLEVTAAALVAFYDWIEKTQGPDYLPRLATQGPRLFTSTIQQLQSIAAGEIAISAFGIPSGFATLVKQGAPIAFFQPNPSLGAQFGLATLGWSKRPEAALVFTDWLMSREGQTVWHSGGETASPLPNIPGSLNAATITTYDIKAYPPDVVKTYRERWDRVFKK